LIEEKKESKKEGMSYLILFSQEVNFLMHNLGEYVNVIIDITGGKDTENVNMDDERKESLVKVVNAMRTIIIKSHMRYNSLVIDLKQKPNDELERIYTKIKYQKIINVEDLEKYTELLNNFLTSEIIQSLVSNNEEIVNDIFTK
jgi:hypothetical protein